VRRAQRPISLLLVLFASLWLSGCPERRPNPDLDADVAPDSVSEPEVVVGTHVQWKRQPDDFVVLEDDGELPIVLGHQGSWMVVLAIRSDALLEGPVDLVIGIEAAGSLLGELQLVDQELDRELDGRDYVYDIWLIVADPSLSTYQAQISVDLVDASGAEMTLERTVVLAGGLD
jgi:hypothetical protein